MLGSDEMRAWYGPDHVRLAADRGAVGTLLISDQLFRYVEVGRNSDSFSHTGTEQVIRKKGKNTSPLLRTFNKRAEKCFNFQACTNLGNVSSLYPLPTRRN